MATIAIIYREFKAGFSPQLRFSSKSKCCYLGCKDIVIPKEYFDKNKKKIKRNCPDFIKLSKALNILELSINNCLENTRFSNIDCHELKTQFTELNQPKQNKKDTTPYFSEFSDQLQTELRNRGKFGTANTYQSATSKFNRFLHREITFQEINYKVLMEFKQYYLGQGLTSNTLSVHLSVLRSIWNEGCRRFEYYPPRNPFAKLITYSRTKKRNMDPLNIQSLLELNLDKRKTIFRDILLLCFYLRGIDLVDVLTIKSFDNEYVLLKRWKLGEKNSLELKIKIEPEAKIIIDKYKKDGSFYLLPFISQDLNSKEGYRQYRNFSRKLDYHKGEMIKMFNIQFAITFKAIRHTWATQARAANLPYDIIQACMGHASSDVTDIYIEYNQEQLNAANRKVIDMVFTL